MFNGKVQVEWLNYLLLLKCYNFVLTSVLFLRLTKAQDTHTLRVLPDYRCRVVDVNSGCNILQRLEEEGEQVEG